MEPEEIDEMKTLLKVARKRSLSFGLCLGKKPEETVLLMHRMKAPNVLQRQAKKAGETNKVAMGEISVKGKQVTLTCEDTPPGLAKRLRLFLKANDMPMKVVVADVAGNLVEQDGEDEDDSSAARTSDTAEDPSDTSQDAPAAEDPMASDWDKVESAFTLLVERYVNSGAENAGKVRAAWDAALGAAESGRYADAIEVSERLKPIVQQVDANPAEDPGADNWSRVQPALGAMVDALAQSEHPNTAKIRTAWNAALGAAEAGKFSDALAVAAKLKPILDVATAEASGIPAEADAPAATALAEEAARVIPKGTVKKRTFMVDRWKKVPGELKIGIDTLAAAISDVAPWEDAPAVGKLVETRLQELVDNMQSQIDKSFKADVGTGDGTYSQTRETISQLRVAAGSDQLLAELKKNLVIPGAPFLDAFTGALDEIYQELGA